MQKSRKALVALLLSAAIIFGFCSAVNAMAPTIVDVEEITVLGEANLALGTNTSYTAQILPEDASNQTVSWSVTPGTGSATITQEGLLSATAVGTVTVKASANDDSGVYGEKEVTIVNWLGLGTSASPYIIETKAQLDLVRTNLSACYKLANDIIFAEEDFTEGGDFYNGGSGFAPIGSFAEPFTGTFDGGNFAIEGLKQKIYIDYSYPQNIYAGLFGRTENGAIKNLSMTSCSISVYAPFSKVVMVGMLAGYSTSSITNCVNNSDLNISLTGSSNIMYMGGLVGRSNGTIINSSNTATIGGSSKNGFYVGGIAGYSEGAFFGCVNSGSITYSQSSNGVLAGGIAGRSTGALTNCSNSGNISAYSYNLTVYVGGLCGDQSASVTNCFNTGDVSATSGGNVMEGGLIGYFSGSVNKAYNIGNVRGVSTGSMTYIGGVIGYHTNIGTVSNVYNAGKISSQASEDTQILGGVTAYVSRNTIYYTNCYNSGVINASTSKLPAIIGGVIGQHTIEPDDSVFFFEGTADFAINYFDKIAPCKITQTMAKEQSTYTGFDFENVWTMDGNSTYPYPELIMPTLSGEYLTGITVSSERNYIKNTETLQMNAEVTSADADDPSYSWSVKNISGEATISADGILTPISNGVVTVRATANDISGVFDEKNITIYSYEGAGTQTSPYLIKTKTQLDCMRVEPNASYRLCNDITFTEADFAEGGAFYNEGAGFVPIGSYDNHFGGELDGDGHKIVGLTQNISAGSEDAFGGLLGYVLNATVSDLNIVAGKFTVTCTTGKSYSGAIAGCVIDSQISGCSADAVVAAISPWESYAGGLAGISESSGGKSIFDKCYTKGSVSAQYCGGLIGHAKVAEFTDCYSAAEVIAPSGAIFAGGFAGKADGADFSRCYSLSEIKNSPLSFIPVDGYLNCDFSSCYCLSNVSGSVAAPVGINVLSSNEGAEMKLAATYVGFDFNTIWTMTGTSNYPYPELISNSMSGSYVETIEITSEASVENKSTLQLSATAGPDAADNKNIKWFITQGQEFATIDENGLLSASAPGSVTVCAAAVDIPIYYTGGAYAQKTITVTPILVSSITVSSQADTVVKTKTLQMNATDILPADADNKAVVWSVIPDTGEATIDTDGLLTATKAGTVTVRATAADAGGKYGEKQITITPLKLTSLSVTSEADTVIKTNTLQMSVSSLLPSEADDKTVDWSVIPSTGEATIAADGLLTATKVGTVTIRATAKDASGTYNEKEITITPLKVAEITVGSTLDYAVRGRTLQMSVTSILPEGADDKSYTWSVISGIGEATITQAGLLTANRVGEVTVVATANDGSGVYGEKPITIVAPVKVTNITVSSDAD